ncbi:MAG: cytochrome b/b6 domain-containing protein [Pseudorhodobacter sp.]
MPLANTAHSYGSVARCLHWITAALILAALPLGVIANDLPYGTSEELLHKAWMFSLHKTFGITAFFTGLARILWAVTQTHPAPLHPERRAETLLANAVHWMLYVSLLAVPLTGWIHHAATSGFAPILWPLGQGLPFVPTSEAVAGAAASLHGTFTKLLAASVVLHVAGALKHHLFDRDSTLLRMISGQTSPEDAGPRPRANPRSPLPALVTLLTFAAATGFTLFFWQMSAQPEVPVPTAARTQLETGNWQVEEGQLAITVRQLGAPVTGQFDRWQADIRYDDRANSPTGTVSVRIDMASLRLGSVTTQAQGTDFLDISNHSEALFEAAITTGDTGAIAAGTLILRGISHPVTLPFSLTIEGDSAQMTGSTTLDRRDFGIGQSYGDEATVGFSVSVDVTLTARRVPPYSN